MDKVKFAIVGNGNLGQACKKQISKRPDKYNLTGVFSRRKSDDTIPLNSIGDFSDEIDVALFCGGSSGDAQTMVPQLNKMGFNTVDSFDNHGEIKNGNYIKAIRAEAEKSGTTAIIGAGWDPGYLSIQRILNKAMLPDGVTNVFYGGSEGGLSMGHSNAVRSINGVIDGCQLTVTRDEAFAQALRGEVVPSNDKHKRVCFVVAEPGREQEIGEQICDMPGYFAGQQVEVNFMQLEEYKKRFDGYSAHSGRVISADDNVKINTSLEMQSNPLFTANAMLAFGRANKIMQDKEIKGVYTIAEVAPAYLVDEETHLQNI